MPRMLKYQEIEGWLRQELSGGRFAPGDRFHSENDAARRFGVTAVTARKAFAPLEQAGYIDRKRGSGTFVLRLPDRPEQIRLFRRCLFGIMIAEAPLDNRLKTGQMLIELHRAVEAAGYLALLTGDDPAPLLEAGVDAVIVFQVPAAATLKQFRDAQIPVAGLHTDRAPYPVLKPDFDGAAGQMVRLFHRRGFRRLLVTGAGADAERVDGEFRAPLDRAAAAAGIECSRLIAPFDSLAGELTEKLRSAERPDVIFALNSWCLDQLFTALRRARLHIPGDVSLLVHGSNSLAIPSEPPCSIIDFDPAAAAAETVGALIRQLRHSSEPPPHRPIPYRITDRGSIARR